MPADTRRSRPFGAAHHAPYRLALFGLLVAAAATLGLATPAGAHNYVISTVPKAGSVLTELPKQFSVTTNDTLLNLGGNGHGFALRIRDADGLYYGDGCVKVEGPSISTDAAIGKPGEYTMLWQLISTDGHTISDEIPFTWRPASETTTPSTGAKVPPDCHGTQPAGSSQATAAPATPKASSSIPIGDVLWIGAAIVLVGLAVLISLLVAGRRKAG